MNELIYDYKELERSKQIQIQSNSEIDEAINQENENEVKTLKANIRFLNFYKLSMKVCIRVENYNSEDNQDFEMSASLANILVLPPVHEEIKKLFYDIAIQENLKAN